MTVCFVCFQYLRTAGEAHLAIQDAVLIAKSLDDPDTNLYFMYSGEMERESLTEAGIIPVRYTTLGKGMPKPLQVILTYPSLISSIFRLARSAKVDIFLNVWNHYELFPVFIGKLFTRSRVLARIVGLPIKSIPPKGSGRLRRWKRSIGLWMERYCLNKADGICTISDYLKEAFVTRGIPAEEVSVISTGIDTHAFRPAENSDRDEETVSILYVGRFHVNKGIDKIIRAVSLLKAEGETVKLVLAGFGPEQAKLEELADRLNLTKDVEFKGQVDNRKLASVYNSCHIAVFPTVDSEGLGKAVLEAGACGLPVVVTRVGALPSLASDGQGIIIPSPSERAIADAVGLLCRSPELRTEMGEKARRFVEDNHSLAVVGKEYEHLFKRLAG